MDLLTHNIFFLRLELDDQHAVGCSGILFHQFASQVDQFECLVELETSGIQQSRVFAQRVADHPILRREVFVVLAMPKVKVMRDQQQGLSYLSLVDDLIAISCGNLVEVHA